LFAVGRATLGVDATLGVHLLRTHYDVIVGGNTIASRGERATPN
jgi:hypothetical protein